jgi:hypothetical protein
VCARWNNRQPNNLGLSIATTKAGSDKGRNRERDNRVERADGIQNYIVSKIRVKMERYNVGDHDRYKAVRGPE